MIPSQYRPISDLLLKATDCIAEFGPDLRHYQDKMADLHDRFSEGRFHLAVLGQFKRGKSTLLNALTGESILPVGIVPLTAAPTFIQFARSPKIKVFYQNESPPEEFVGGSTSERSAYLSEFVTEKGNPKNRRGISEVIVDLPAPILSSGVVLIDTPGIGSTYRHNTTATLNFLRQCDAGLFLVSADPPITEVELEFLHKVKEKIPRLFFVLNKIDYLNEDELKEALSFYRHVLSGEMGAPNDLPVFCISARTGLEAREQGDPGKWIASGMRKLESFLFDFLAREKFAALADAVTQKALGLTEAVLMDARIALSALKLPRQELAGKITAFEESLKRAESERRLIQDILEADKKRVVAFVEEQAREMFMEAEHFLKDIMNRAPLYRRQGSSTKAGIQEAWAEEIPDFFAQQQETLNERVKEHLVDCLTPHEQRHAQLVEMLRNTAADLFNVPYKPLAQENMLEIKRRPYWVVNTWNTDPLPILQSMDQRLDGLARRNVENIRWSTLQNLNISFAGFTRSIRDGLNETIVATKGAMEAAFLRQQNYSESMEMELNRLACQIDVLEQVKEQFYLLRHDLRSQPN